MNQLLSRLVPFIFLGIVIVALVAGVVLLSYLLILGSVVGLVLFLTAWIWERLSPTKKKLTKKEKSGHTIEHKDI